MTQAERGDLVLASDGLLARVVGGWSEEKLFYLGRYIDIFSTGMKSSWPRRVYIDLFSGPGRSVIEDSAREIDGSPMLAVAAKSPFTGLYFSDADQRAVNALKQRISADSRSDLQIRSLDCNDAARDVRSALFAGSDSGSTLGLAFIDPTAFQIRFSALAEMTRGLHIDLIITVMTGYLKRFIAEPGYGAALDGFFGSPEWRSLIDLRMAGNRLTFRRLLDQYESNLRDIGYVHVDDDIRVLNSNESTIYHLVFASKHPRGADFFKKISQRRFTGQLRMGDVFD